MIELTLIGTERKMWVNPRGILAVSSYVPSSVEDLKRGSVLLWALGAGETAVNEHPDEVVRLVDSSFHPKKRG